MTPSSPTTPTQKPIRLGTWIGVIGVLIFIVMVVVFSLASSSRTTVENKAEAENAAAQEIAAAYARSLAAQEAAQVIPEVPGFPRAGDGYPTKDKPTKAWIDPNKTHTRATAAVQYCVADPENSEMCWTDHMDGHDVGFRNFPAGPYLVSPLGDGKVFFHWWQ
ncbi:hypothetical protein HY311_03380 [Candidatus Nomurabacteria bacterium]|nr:hypothetical protein [Candidatus Nomurabacteria bacterium]